jgi:hypothetical protein
VNRFSKQSAIALAFSVGRKFAPEEPWIAVGALESSLFSRALTMGHTA